MILAFPMWRKGFAKPCGSVIDEALRRKHTVHLWWADVDKPGERVDVRDLDRLWPRAALCENRPRCDAIIGDPSVGEMPGLPAAPKYALDFVWEQRMRKPMPGVTRCWATEDQLETFGGVETWASEFGRIRKIRDRDPVIGMTALDALPLVDPAAVRAKYNLGDRPILLLFALKFGGVNHLWRQTTYRWWHYMKLLRAIRAYCDRHGYALVVKTREKNHDPAFVRDLADRVIGDESLWPYTSAELVRVAALAIHFQSGAVFECAAARVPQLSIAMPQPHLAHLGGHDVFFSTAPRSLQHWPGVVQSVGWQDAAYLFAHGRVWDTTIGYERMAYADRFVGPLDGKSAVRVLDMIEARQ